MSRIALVVQRCHPHALGGSEALAWHYAQLLSEQHDVEILTSCALDYVRWDNALPEGVEHVDGIGIRRFAVAFPRGREFTELHRRMLADHARDGALPHWREALAEAFIRAQGPWCPGLIAHLRERHEDYAAVIACTYLYPTTYFGLDVVPPAKRVLVPTLHDEPPAYLRAYAQRAASCANLLWLTDAERALGAKLWNAQRGDVIGMAVDAPASATPERRDRAYFLYCGRIDESKGVCDLLTAFDALRADGAAVELVLTGEDLLGLPRRDDVCFLGRVDETRKAALMAGCAAFVMPSAHESFSIVTLEAMAQGAVVVVNGASEVLASHVSRSGSGFVFNGVDDAAEQMRKAMSLSLAQRAQHADAGQRYVRDTYSRERVGAALRRALEVLVTPSRRTLSSHG